MHSGVTATTHVSMLLMVSTVSLLINAFRLAIPLQLEKWNRYSSSIIRLIDVDHACEFTCDYSILNILDKKHCCKILCRSIIIGTISIFSKNSYYIWLNIKGRRIFLKYFFDEIWNFFIRVTCINVNSLKLNFSRKFKTLTNRVIFLASQEYPSFR